MSSWFLWSPDPQFLSYLTRSLIHSMSNASQEREQAMETLETFQLQSELWNHLCYLLIEGDQDMTLKQQFEHSDLQNCRAIAGMFLKNSMLKYSLSNYDLSYLKGHLVRGLYSSTYLISNITGIVITTLFSIVYRKNRQDPLCLETLSKLLDLIHEGNEASVKTISKIIEDNIQLFQLTSPDNPIPMDSLIAKFLEFMKSSNYIIRFEIIKCFSHFITFQIQEFIVNIDNFLQILFELCEKDDNSLVTQQICICFVHLLEVRPDKLMIHLPGIVQFVLHLIQNSQDDEKLKLEACEVLLALSSNKNIPGTMIISYMPAIVPVLLSNMVYSSEQILLFETFNDDDCKIKDKDEEIKPSSARINKKKDNMGDLCDHDDVDHDWNVRKCCAATLDALTNILPKNTLEIALPLLRDHLASTEWYVREATMLSLGAMAEGGIRYFQDQLFTLIPFLTNQLNDRWAPVRKITCWTLSKFSPWILNDHTEFLIPVLKPILDALLDKNKGVQEAAISSVAIFIENSDPELIETLLYQELLNKFNQCFKFYQKKNLIILYDAVGVLAEKCLFDETAVNLIIPHLIDKWSSLDDNDKELWPLLECLSYVSTSLGEKFMPMAPDVYARAWRILCHCIKSENNALTDSTIEVPEKDFIITSLDLIDGLIQGLGAQSQKILFPNGDCSLLQMIFRCLEDTVPEVRQSCFSLVGDIVQFYDILLIQSSLPNILKLIATELLYNDDSKAVSSFNNAIWVLGLIAERFDILNHIIDLSHIVIDLFTNTTLILPDSVIENLTVTIGRMAKFHPEVFTEGLFADDDVWLKWCEKAQYLRDPVEKLSAYIGFVKIINLTTSVIPSKKTLKLFFNGLSKDIDPSSFIDDLYAFMIRHETDISPEYTEFVSQLI